MYCSDCFDATLCIAVLHHLGSVDRRVAVIRELLRVTKPGGVIFLQAWAMEQDDASKRKFYEQDVMVPWRLQKQFLSPSSSSSSPDAVKDSGQELTTSQTEEGAGASTGGHTHSNSNSNTNNSTSSLPCKTKKKKKKESKKDCDAIDRTVNKKSYRSVHDKDHKEFAADEITNSVDGKKDLITYERYCHVYRKGELEDLCSCIPNCQIIESGWDKSNWFVQIKKIQDPRIILPKNCYYTHSKHEDAMVSRLENVGISDSLVDSGDTIETMHNIGIGISQPLPAINLRTL